jgi:hypothetical protein
VLDKSLPRPHIFQIWCRLLPVPYLASCTEAPLKDPFSTFFMWIGYLFSQPGYMWSSLGSADLYLVRYSETRVSSYIPLPCGRFRAYISLHIQHFPAKNPNCCTPFVILVSLQQKNSALVWFELAALSSLAARVNDALRVVGILHRQGASSHLNLMENIHKDGRQIPLDLS